MAEREEEARAEAERYAPYPRIPKACRPNPNPGSESFSGTQENSLYLLQNSLNLPPGKFVVSAQENELYLHSQPTRHPWTVGGAGRARSCSGARRPTGRRRAT